MSMAAKLLRGSALRIVDMAVLLGATFLVTPLLVHSLGARHFGFWTLAGALVGYYGFLELGLQAAATRYMSQALGKGDEEELDRVGSTTMLLFYGTGAVVLAVTAVSALACPAFIADPAEAALFQKVLLLLGLACALGFPARVYSGLLMAGVRYDVTAGISIARNLLYFGAIYAAARAGHGLLSIAAVSFAVTLLERAALRAACGRRFSVRRWDRTKVPALFDYGSKMLVCHVGDILRFRLDSVVIAAFLGAGLVTPYAVATRLLDGFSRLVSTVTGTLLPVFSRYDGRGDMAAARRALLKSTKAGAMLSGFTGLSIIFYGRAFIERWMGPGFEDSYRVAAILCAAYTIGLPLSPGTNLLYGLSKHKFYAVMNVCEGLANLALSVLLLRSFGILGVALGTLVEMAVFKLIIQPVYVCRVAGLPLRLFVVDTILVTLLKTAAPLALYFLAVSRFVTPDYLTLAACAVVQAAVFAPFAWFFILDAEERALVAPRLVEARA